MGDSAFNKIFIPMPRRLIAKRRAFLRMTPQTREHGNQVYFSPDEIDKC